MTKLLTPHPNHVGASSAPSRLRTAQRQPAQFRDNLDGLPFLRHFTLTLHGQCVNDYHLFPAISEIDAGSDFVFVSARSSSSLRIDTHPSLDAITERLSPQFLTPTSHAPVIRIESPARSNSTTSSFTPAVIGPGSPRYSCPRAESEGSREERGVSAKTCGGRRRLTFRVEARPCAQKAISGSDDGGTRSRFTCVDIL